MYNTQNLLKSIDEAVELYARTGNRMVLTKIRQLTTKLYKQSPAMSVIRLPEIAQKHGISMKELNW